MFRLYLLLLCLLASEKPLAAQCPINLDFEQGTWSNWECRIGRVESVNGVNSLSWLVNGQQDPNHLLISRQQAQLDPFGGFSQASPNGSNYSVRLGNNFFQAYSAESISYTFRIPDTMNQFSVLYYYAVVFQDPQHNADEQPRFRTSLLNLTDNQLIRCSDFDYTASASLPGFQVSTVDTTVIYKDWTPVTLNLSGLAGKTIRLEFTTSDCTFRGHFGYAYIDINTSCGDAIVGSRSCPEADQVNLTAPFGFQSYKWFPTGQYTQLLSTQQTLTIQPPPPVGTGFTVTLTPYPGFGCPDTIHTTVEKYSSPIAVAGNDTAICLGSIAQLGSYPVPEYRYLWEPAAALQNATSSNPLTWPQLDTTTQFYLRAIDTTTGCQSVDTVIVKPIHVRYQFERIGDTIICLNKPVQVQLIATPESGRVQWYTEQGIIGGADQPLYLPLAATTTTYHAKIVNGPCTAITPYTTIVRTPIPRARISAQPDRLCTERDLIFESQTISPTNQALQTNWRLSDGRIFVGEKDSTQFQVPGRYQLSLLVENEFGCRDSASTQIEVLESCKIYIPTAFTPNRDGKNDLFGPQLFGTDQILSFRVFDRTGQMIFHTTSTQKKWDGRFRGQPMQAGVYVWQLDYLTDQNKNHHRAGTILLIR